MIALMRGWEWLTDDQRARIAEAVPRTLTANALRSELGASWRGVVAIATNLPRTATTTPTPARGFASTVTELQGWYGIRGCAVHVG